MPGAEYNIDGTVGLSTNDQNPTGITEHETTSEQKITSEQDRADEHDNALILEALKAYRDAGIDINSVIDSMVEQNKTQKSIGNDSTIESIN